MGVLACNRSGCEHIMCNRLILDDSMYICGDCWDELLEHRKSWPDRMPIDEVRDRILEFMRTEPKPPIVIADRDDIDAEFNRLTGRSRS